MSKSDDFRATVRHGLRVGRPALVLHADRCDAQGVQVGFIVSRSVGNAVARNRVRRRLRHLAADRLASTPAGTNVVVRALPRAATMPAELPSQFADAWQAAMSRLGAREVRR